jgi:hypothetical protein
MIVADADGQVVDAGRHAVRLHEDIPIVFFGWHRGWALDLRWKLADPEPLPGAVVQAFLF